MIHLTEKEEKMHNKQKVCCICKQRFYIKGKDHCH